MGFTLNPSVMTMDEQLIYSEIVNMRRQLLNSWDNSTEVLIGHRLPPYKCSWCGKRSNKGYTIDNDERNYCSKHYKEFTHD